MQRGVKAPPERLRAALQGRVTERHRFLLRLHLRHIDALDTAIAEIDAEVNRDLDPFRQAVRQLQTIPGVSDLTAQVIVSEIGIDMSRFPTAGHLISWAGLCPRNDESAGKRRSTRLRKGAPWLKTTVVQCAWAASRKKASYLQAQFQRLGSVEDPRRPSAPSPPRSSPPPTTCSATARSIRTSEPTTSTVTHPRFKQTASPVRSPNLASSAPSHPQGQFLFRRRRRCGERAHENRIRQVLE